MEDIKFILFNGIVFQNHPQYIMTSNGRGLVQFHFGSLVAAFTAIALTVVITHKVSCFLMKIFDQVLSVFMAATIAATVVRFLGWL